MALAGHGGTVTFTPAGSELAKDFVQTAQVRKWAVLTKRQMVDVSGKGLAYKTWAAGQYTWWLALEGFGSSIAADEDAFLNKGLLQVDLDFGGVGSENITGVGWFEQVDWSADVDSMTMFKVLVRMITAYGEIT